MDSFLSGGAMETHCTDIHATMADVQIQYTG